MAWRANRSSNNLASPVFRVRGQRSRLQRDQIRVCGGGIYFGRRGPLGKMIPAHYSEGSLFGLGLGLGVTGYRAACNADAV